MKKLKTKPIGLRVPEVVLAKLKKAALIPQYQGEYQTLTNDILRVVVSNPALLKQIISSAGEQPLPPPAPLT